MAVDLHVHSRASDGTDTPRRVVELAASAGLTAIALTDHDTLDGVPEALEAGAAHGIEVIPGTELSLEYDGGMHLIVLWLQPAPGPLQDRLESLRSGRRRRNSAILDALGHHGIDVSEEELANEAGGGSVGRPHIAAAMMAKGYVPDIATAFDLWLGRGRPGYVTRERLTAVEAIGLARESGAVPVLAHPHTLGINRAEEMARLLGELTHAGLVGLEALYGGYHRHERDGYSDLARRFGLIPSGGSDYHGAYKPGLEIGSGYGDLHVPETVLEELRGLSYIP
jgi:3',5'-nucleoside bisphosphate phosphatase